MGVGVQDIVSVIEHFNFTWPGLLTHHPPYCPPVELPPPWSCAMDLWPLSDAVADCCGALWCPPLSAVVVVKAIVVKSSKVACM